MLNALFFDMEETLLFTNFNIVLVEKPQLKIKFFTQAKNKLKTNTKNLVYYDNWKE